MDVLARVGLAHLLRESGEHLVRRRALAVHEAVREVLRTLPEWLERHGNDRGGHEDSPSVTPITAPITTTTST